jgi:hypothetical protein
MHFKQPEILYFLLLLIVPILVHLFQLRRFKKEYFTNVRFLKALSIQSRKSSKIKKWLLLATRILLLICIILAFAQPYFDSKDTQNSTNEMYIILDNSFSMQAKGKKGELLKRAVQELLEETPENRNFSLLTNTDNYWNTDIKTIRNSLQNLDYSAIPFRLDQQIAKIKSHKSAFKKDIVIITDAIGIENRHLKNLERNNTTYFIIPKAEQENNVSVDSVYIHQTLDSFYEITVKLTAFGEEKNPIPVALYNQKKLVAKTNLSFDTAIKTINFTIPKKEFHGYITIEDNGLNYDNKLFFSILKNKKNKVISIGEPEKSNFLSRIYTSDEFTYRNFSLTTLDYNSIEEQDAILLNELSDIPQALQTTLKSFVEKGGNLIIIPSESISISNMNAFLKQFGSLEFKNLENTEKQITKINFDHPLFNGVFENKISNFQFPKTKKTYRIANSSPAILAYEDQSPFLTAIRNPISAVYIFSAPLNTDNSNFQHSPLIVPTLYKMGLNTQNKGINALTIGNNIPYYIEMDLSKEEILTLKGDSEQFIPLQQIFNNKVKLNFNDYPEQAGNFRIYNKTNAIENVSFNYNRGESNLAHPNEDILDEYKKTDSIDTVFNTIQTDRTDNQLWKWFLIFALLLLITEMAIIRLVK